jgi:palmitoyl transferase
MKFPKITYLLASYFIFVTCLANAQTNNVSPSESTQEEAGWFKKTSRNAINTVENLYDNGRLSMTLSGYARHGRNTYSPERLAELNEKVWGFGVSKELRDKKDNEESIQFIAMADSHYKPQFLASYNYQWMKPLGDKWEAGIGYAVGFGSRTDIKGGIPFPGILPLASIGTRDTKLIMTYIPRLNGKGNGDVLFFGLRVSLK